MKTYNHVYLDQPILNHFLSLISIFSIILLKQKKFEKESIQKPCESIVKHIYTWKSGRFFSFNCLQKN